MEIAVADDMDGKPEGGGDFGELGEGGLQVFYDLGGDDIGVGEIRAVFE